MSNDKEILGKGNDEVDEIIRKASNTKEPVEEVPSIFDAFLGRNSMRHQTSPVKEVDYAKAMIEGAKAINAIKERNPEADISFIIVVLKSALSSAEEANKMKQLEESLEGVKRGFPLFSG